MQEKEHQCCLKGTDLSCKWRSLVLRFLKLLIINQGFFNAKTKTKQNKIEFSQF